MYEEKKLMQLLSDPAAEKAVLAALYKYGKDMYIDICDVVQQSKTFTIQYNQLLYSCFQYIYEKYESSVIDIATIYSASKDIGVDSILTQKDCKEHIEQVLSFNIDKSNVRTLAAKIRRLAIARIVNEQLQAAQGEIQNVSGNESASHILGIAESSVLD